jgi:hypothetical protein
VVNEGIYTILRWGIHISKSGCKLGVTMLTDRIDRIIALTNVIHDKNTIRESDQ